MKYRFTKRISAVVLTVAILFTSVFSMSIIANAATAYSPRLSAPASTNKYYYSDLNVFYKYGYGMPNCTAYAYGRAYEILKTEPKLSWGNAEQWYGYNKSNGYYSYGKTPKLGAIACWAYDGGGGHVAVVEKIENGQITFSNSAWSGNNFYLTYASTSDSNAGGSSWWNFQGYIYIGEFSGGQAETLPIKYKTGIYKTTTALNMRNGVGTGNSVLATIPNNTQITVTNVKSDSDYNWGYTTYNGKSGWVCMDYCSYVGAVTQPTTAKPTTQPTTAKPTTQPTTAKPTTQPTTATPTTQPTTAAPATQPTTKPSSGKPADGLGVGDINGDGYVTIADATMIQLYVSSQIELTDEQIAQCDFDFDGQITIMDTTCIQKYLTY